MSKYVKLEEVIETVYQCRRAEANDEWIKRWLEPLNSLPTIEVSEDCISREYLKSLGYINKGDFNSVETIREWIDNAPSVVPTTEQSSMVGEWIDYYYPYFEVTGIACSVCGKDVPYWSRHNEIPNYCPNCGARMKGAE